MSTITFPGQPSSSPHDNLYPLSFDTTGFQMNPGSAHPPRTPRSSVTMPYSSQASTGHDGTEDCPTELEIELGEEEEEEASQEKSATKGRVHIQEVWRDLLETSTGRDKAFVLHFTSSAVTPTDCLGIGDIQKIIQYSMKVYLLFHHAVSRRMPVQAAGKGAFERSLLRRLESTVSGLSVTRCVPTIHRADHMLTFRSLETGNALSCSIG